MLNHCNSMRRRFLNAVGVGGLAVMFPFFSRGEQPITDLPEDLKKKIVQGGRILLPAGNFLVNETISLKSGTALVGQPGCVLIRDSSARGAVFASQSAEDLSIDGIDFDARLPAPVSWMQPGGLSKVVMPISMPWKFPALSLSILSSDRKLRKLVIGRDFDILDFDGSSVEILLKNQNALHSNATLLADIPLGLDAFVAFEDCTRVRINNISCKSGGIAYVGAHKHQASLVISNCRILNGQIRVLGPANNFYPLMKFARSNLDLEGPSDIVIRDNHISGSAGLVSNKYRIPVNERVHGIVVSGFSRGLKVHGNIVESSMGDGISMPSVVDANLSNNKFLKNALSGIGPENGTVRHSREMIFDGNVSSFNWFDGIDLNFANPAKLEEHQILDSKRGVPVDAVVTRNVFEGNGVDGVDMNGGCGIYLRYGSLVDISGNRCISNNVNGIKLQISSAINVVNNFCEGNGRTSRLPGDSRQRAAISVEGCVDVKLGANNFGDLGSAVKSVQQSGWRGEIKNRRSIEVK